MTRSERWSLAILCVAACVLRAAPFFREGGVLGWPVDYDEGVYLSAARLLTHGSLPWRDFAFVHPPGVLFFLAPFTALEPRAALEAARWVVTLVGVANVALVFAVVRTRTSFVGALAAAALYAGWTEALGAERRLLIEPLLNLACLGSAWAVLRPERSPRAIALAGALLGLALCVKSWAVLWVAGALAAAPSPRVAAKWLVAALLVALAVSGWLVLFAPRAAWDATIAVHLSRPPDGDLSRLGRLREMFYARSVLPAATVLLTLPWLVRRARDAGVRFFAVTLSLVVVAFLASAAWWNQYDSHLAAAVSPLAGLGVGFATERFRVRTAGAIVLALVLGVPGALASLEFLGFRDPEQVARAASIARVAPVSAKVCAFEVGDALLANRWPAAPIDSYGQQLIDAMASGRRFDSTNAAFADEASQASVWSQLVSCDVVVLGWRCAGQCHARARTRFDEGFIEVVPDIFVKR